MDNYTADIPTISLTQKSFVARIAALTVLYFLLAAFGVALLQSTEFIAPLWPASAVALVFLIHSRPAQWTYLLLACYVAGLTVDLIYGGQWILSMLLSAADILDAVLGALLIKMYLRKPLNIKNLGDFLAFLTFGGLVAPVTGATLAGFSVHQFHGLPFWQEWYGWWASTAVGVFVVGPVFLFWNQAKPKIIFSGPRAAETGILMVSGVTVIIVAFNTQELPLLFLVVPWLLWASVRLGIGATLWLGLLLSMAAIWATVERLPGMHWFGADLRTQVQSVQLYLTIAIIPALIVAITLSERRRSELHNRQLASALQQTADAVMVTDTRGVIEYVNPAFEQMTGFAKSTALGATPRILRSGHQDAKLYRKLWQDLTDGKDWSDVLINRRKDGSLYFEEKTISPIREDSGLISHYVSTGKDITERIKTQEKLQFLAYHDVLTKLPNRALLMERLGHAVAKARRAGYGVAVMFIDLDGFKLINDALGHEVGDKVLIDVASRLKNVVREEDTIARLGGDEFTVLIEEVEYFESVSEIATKLLQDMQEPMIHNDETLSVMCSIGISMFPDDAETPAELVQRADTAMYRAKESGRNRFQFYSAEMGVQVERQLYLLIELRRALNEDQFVLHYQPQLNLRTHRVEVVEALLRWNHPQRGLEAPGEFLPVLEESVFIREVGEWVLKQACQDAAKWNSDRSTPLRVAINLSGVQLEEESLVNQVKTALLDNALEPSMLECEITETSIMLNPEKSADILKRLGALGVIIAIDDFGTGYSSLAYLKQFPVQVLKIDRTFVRDILEDEDDLAIVSAVLALAGSLSLDVVAEGVETEAQLRILRDRGCDSLQGYYFGRPVPASELDDLISKIESSRYDTSIDQ